MGRRWSNRSVRWYAAHVSLLSVNCAMAAELAEGIYAFWQARGDKAEHTKWQKVYQDHLQQTT